METKTVAVESRRARPLNQSIVLIALILAICVVTAIVNPRFLRVQNLINIFQQISILGIVACGIGMLLVAGQIDISVGTQISFLGVMLAMIIQKMMGLPDGGVPGWQSALAFPMAIVVTFAVGLAMGLINGLTVIYSRAASFIITLGFSTAYHGAALLLSGGASYMLFGRFELLGRGRVLDIVPISILFFLGMVGITFVVLRYFRYGRFLYAIGGNKKAAFVSGINTTRVTLIAYLVVGACNALAALILISRVGFGPVHNRGLFCPGLPGGRHRGRCGTFGRQGKRAQRLPGRASHRSHQQRAHHHERQSVRAGRRDRPHHRSGRHGERAFRTAENIEGAFPWNASIF